MLRRFFASLILPFTFSVAAAEAPADLARQVQGIFREKCAACHSPNSTENSAKKKWLGPDHIAELTPKYVPKGIKAENDAEFWQIVGVKKEMPPEPEPGEKAKGVPLTNPEIEIIRSWLRAGAPQPVEPIASAPRMHISDEQVLTLIHQDLLNLKSDRKRRNTRYITLTHFHNNLNEKEAQIEEYRQGVRKLLNSLTWMPDLVKPQAIDPERTIYRINLLDLDWTPEQWEELVAAYPYGIDYKDQLTTVLRTLTGSKLCALRGDWFAFAASQPPFYHSLLGLPEGETSLTKLEQRLNVKRIHNIQNGRADRAAIGNGHSGVSANNRLVERHTAAYGAYWLSYDFDKKVGSADLLANPLGPPDVFGGSHVFKHAGGEVIFNLPNHLQGYLLVNSSGNRLDIAPPFVHDLENERDSGQIINGVSCINCHYAGMRSVQNELLTTDKDQMAAFNRGEVEFIRELYPSAEDFKKRLNNDEQTFRKVLADLGISDPRAFTLAGEPIHVLVERFRRNVNLDSAAAEVGLTADEFKQRLSGDPTLRGFLTRFTGGLIARETFIDDFDRIVTGAGIGKHLDFKPVAMTAAKTPDEIIINSIGMKASQDLNDVQLFKIQPTTFLYVADSTLPQ